MAVATLPVLGGATLPPPQSHDHTRIYRGGTLIMASGKIIHDLTDNTPRHRFTLSFIFLTAAQLTTLQTAYDNIKNQTATYTDIRNLSFTVTRPDGGELDVQAVVTAGGDIRYNVSMELLEDS
jgi:hypothetical protein